MRSFLQSRYVFYYYAFFKNLFLQNLNYIVNFCVKLSLSRQYISLLTFNVFFLFTNIYQQKTLQLNIEKILSFLISSLRYLYIIFLNMNNNSFKKWSTKCIMKKFLSTIKFLASIILRIDLFQSEIN